ncbi:MAG TPA: hypothetical protein VM866_08420 [Pyrinomonadaceae bacterium]|nr:hypothetical protein [Pyrinomonadaceae bacterium]
MKKHLVLFALTFTLVAAEGAFGQTAAGAAQTPSGATQTADASITANRVVGEVAVIDSSGKQMFVKTSAGTVVTVSLDSTTTYKRAAPGATNLDNATDTTLAEISVGDRVYARGKVSEDRRSVPARQVIVMSKADISKKHESDRARWNQRGVVGVVSALDPATKEIRLQARGRGEPQSVVIAAGKDAVKFRRYAPDSVKFSDAKESSFAELKVGDQLRALGEKSADGARFTAEEIVSGSFRTMSGTVSAVNAQAGEIKLKDSQSQQELTVVISKDSMARRIPAEFAQMMAMRGGGQGGGPGRMGGGGGEPPQGQAGSARATNPGAGGPPPGGGGARGMGGGGRMMGGGGDFAERLEQLPEVTVAELKPGDTLIVSSTAGTDPSRVTAIHLIAGAEALVNVMQQRRAASGGGPNMSGLGLDFGIGLP